LGAVVDQQEHTGSREALDQAVQEGLGLGIDPVEVLEHQQQGLSLAFPQQHALNGFQGALTALGRIESLPQRIVNWDVQERQKGWQIRSESRIQSEELTGNLLADPPPFVVVFDLKVYF